MTDLQAFDCEGPKQANRQYHTLIMRPHLSQSLVRSLLSYCNSVVFEKDKSDVDIFILPVGDAFRAVVHAQRSANRDMVELRFGGKFISTANKNKILWISWWRPSLMKVGR